MTNVRYTIPAVFTDDERKTAQQTREQWQADVAAQLEKEKEQEVEVVARAMCVAHRGDPDKEIPCEDEPHRKLWQEWTSNARAHIAAFDALWEHRKMPKSVMDGC